MPTYSPFTYKSLAIIDDDRELTNFLQDIARKEGWSVTTYNSTTFVNLFFDAPPDLFLVDVWFDQRADGLNQVIALRNKPELAHIPVIMMSSDGSMKSKSEELGALAFLPKPVEPKTFEVLLNQVNLPQEEVLPTSYDLSAAS